MPVLHLSAAGVPTTWAVTALYRGSYGIAVNSAASWHDRQDRPEAVLEIERGEVKRSEMYWKPKYGEKQNPERPIYIQAHGYNIDEADLELAIEHMTRTLRGLNFLIPRNEWEQRYPGSKLIADRFAEWNEACAAAGDQRIQWEPRWAMFMEPPEDWQAQFKNTEDGLGVIPVDADAEDPTGGFRWDNAETAHNAKRAMNSGFSFEQALVLQTSEPVEAPALTPGV